MEYDLDIGGNYINTIMYTCMHYVYFQSLVQIETFGEFGVFIILFSVGLEFSPDIIRKVKKNSANIDIFIFLNLCSVIEKTTNYERIFVFFLRVEFLFYATGI